MIIIDNLTNGIFKKEAKNRFLCNIEINDKQEECYIPSSSKLENYIRLRNKPVLCLQNKSPKSRTKLSLFAVKYRNKYIVLNLSILNNLIFSELDNPILKLDTINLSSLPKMEKSFGGYKTDIYYNSAGIDNIIEIKGILSTTKKAGFPSVYSERSINQLIQLKNLLINGTKVHYFLVSLSPFVKEIELNNQFVEYLSLFKECISYGMCVQAVSTSFNGRELILKEKIKLSIP